MATWLITHTLLTAFLLWVFLPFLFSLFFIGWYGVDGEDCFLSLVSAEGNVFWWWSPLKDCKFTLKISHPLTHRGFFSQSSRCPCWRLLYNSAFMFVDIRNGLKLSFGSSNDQTENEAKHCMSFLTFYDMGNHYWLLTKWTTFCPPQFYIFGNNKQKILECISSYFCLPNYCRECFHKENSTCMDWCTSSNLAGSLKNSDIQKPNNSKTGSSVFVTS